MTKQNREKFTKKIWDDIFNTNDTSDKQTEYYNVFNYRDSRWYHRTERQSKQLSIIQCLDMIDSIIAYSPQGNKSLARDILNKDLSSKYSYRELPTAKAVGFSLNSSNELSINELSP